MFINTVKYTPSYQTDYLDYYNSPEKMNFIQSVIGVKNNDCISQGMCYGFSDLFLRQAHIGNESKYSRFLSELGDDLYSKKTLTQEKKDLEEAVSREVITTHLQLKSLYKIRNLNLLDDCEKKWNEFFPANANLAESNNTEHMSHEFIEFFLDKNIINPIDGGDYLNYYIDRLKTLTHESINAFYHGLEQAGIPVDLSKQIELPLRIAKQTSQEVNIDVFKKLFYAAKNICQCEAGINMEQLNTQSNIFYHEAVINPDIYFGKNERKSVDELKLFIEDKISNKENMLSFINSQDHAMAMVIKHKDKKVKFKFYDPNLGLSETHNKLEFFKVLDQLYNNSDIQFFHPDDTDKFFNTYPSENEKLLNITESLVANKLGSHDFDAIKVYKLRS